MMRCSTDGLFRRFLLFLYYTGARPCEAAKATWRDLRLDKGKLIIEEHKCDRFGEPRVIYLHPCIVKMLVWIRQHAYSRKYLFVNRAGTRWTNTAISSRLKYIRRVSGIASDTTCYGLRHKFCTDAILSGEDIAIVAQLAGHRRIETTKGYVHLFNQDKHLLAAVGRIRHEAPLE